VRLGLIPREQRFFQLFEREASLVSKTLGELSRSLQEGKSAHPGLRELEHQCDEVTHEIYTLTNRTFTTPMETEDILHLAHALDDIVDLAEEVSDKIDLYKASPIPDDARQMGECLAAAGAEIEKAVRHLDSAEDVQPALLEVHRLENVGDRVTREALQRLFNGSGHDPADLIKWKDLYDLLEDTMDQCESVAEIIETITVKSA
jgi:uncharacterized protein Yka (UPF0111/DUF47 family)